MKLLRARSYEKDDVMSECNEINRSISRSIFEEKFAQLEAVAGVESAELLTRFPNRAMGLIKCRRSTHE